MPLLPFLSAGAAPAVIGSLFGIAGGGLTGYRVRRRWAGVQDFDFVEISGPGPGNGDESLRQSPVKKAPSLVVSLISHDPWYIILFLITVHIGNHVYTRNAA